MSASRARTALADTASLGGFFAVDTGTGPPEDWRPLHTLWTDGETLREHCAAVHRRLAARAGVDTAEVEHRVAASILYQGLASRLLSPALATAVRHGLVVFPASLGRRPAESGPIPLRLLTDRSAPAAEDPAGVLREVIVEGALEPLAEALRGHVRIAPGLLRGNAASSLGGAVRRLGSAYPELAGEAAAAGQALLAAAPLQRTGRYVRPWSNRPATFFVRRTCCLYYRVPGAGKCGDCALLDPAVREARWAEEADSPT